MANSKKVRQKRIERKYEKLISDTFDRLSSEGKTMGELWQELDKLKQQMKEDFKTAGIIVE